MNLKKVAMCAACGQFYSSGVQPQCSRCGEEGTVVDVGYDEGPYRAAKRQPSITTAQAKRQLDASRRQLES